MYFYHEGHHEAYHADAGWDELKPRGRSDDDRTPEPIGIPAIVNWLVIVSVALCVVVTVIDGLS